MTENLPHGIDEPTAPTRLTPGARGFQRPFEAIVFDWDGTAVADRHEDADALVTSAEALLRLDVWLVVITGTNFGNIDRQFCSFIAPSCRGHLVVCANRGSEVYGFDRRGKPVSRWRRVATPAEDLALTTTADAVREAIHRRTGLEIRVVYDRLNRRKIDLIPLPEWADPPKDQIGALLVAVEERLRAGGWAGGIGEVIRLSAEFAREHGLPQARITSDVKHVEVGLTDKGDAFVWVKRELLPAVGIALRDVLVAGDEFGPIADFAGSDDRLRAEAGEATVVSVGAEPNGVPGGVVHLGGGPHRFRALLADQVWLHQRRTARAGEARDTEATADASTRWASGVLAPTVEPAWRLENHDYQPAVEHQVESRFTVSNGFIGVRGSLEQPTPASRPRTFVSGLFDTQDGDFPTPALVPGPDWMRFRILVHGQPLSIESGEFPRNHRTLDFDRGVLLTDWLQRALAESAVRVRTLRCVSLADRRIALQVAQVSVDQPVPMSFEAWLEPPGGRLLPERAAAHLTVWRTAQAARRLAVAHTSNFRVDGHRLRSETRDGRIRWRWVATPGQVATFTRIVAFARGDENDTGDHAMTALRRAQRMGAARLLAAHELAWNQRWSASDVQVEGDEQAQQGLRFALYHLIGAANPDDDRVSIGARALTGDAYLGHVFWDTEAFILPFHSFTWPAAARAALMYRFHALPAARQKAERLGYRGALYAWESAEDGAEVTPPFVLSPTGQVIPIRSGNLEQHISADVAYAVWQYWQATADTRFLIEAGADILLETARFWASRAALEDDGHYHIRGVIGPDEYHVGVDDNAYTNALARWNLERGLEVARLLVDRWPEPWNELSARLEIADEELAQWREIANQLTPGATNAEGVPEQFAGYFGLEPIDLAAYEPRTAPIDVILGPERTQRSQVIKQADAVMLQALLWDRFPPAVHTETFRYYEPRCGHGSSLSPPIHALVAARLGDVAAAERYFHQTVAIDLDDAMGNAGLGVHVGALGGLWQAAVFGFAGLSLRPEGIVIDPHLPASWHALRFPVRWRGRQIRFDITQAPPTVTARLIRGRPMTLYLGRLRRRLVQAGVWICSWDERDGQWKEVSG